MDTPARTPVRLPPLAKQVEGILVERIRSGSYPANTQLPAEQELADELNVSRATLRSALSSLAALGLVIRRHGAGTFVTQMPRISNPLDKLIDFQELISRYCSQASVEYMYTGLEQASSSIAAALQIPANAQVFVTEKIFTGDGEPLIYCTNTLPAGLFGKNMLDELLAHPNRLEPIFQFMEKDMNMRVEFLVARVHAAIARKCRFSVPLPLPGSTPIMVIDDIAYTAGGIPVFHTVEYHPENKMNFELIRRMSG